MVSRRWLANSLEKYSGLDHIPCQIYFGGTVVIFESRSGRAASRNVDWVWYLLGGNSFGSLLSLLSPQKNDHSEKKHESIAGSDFAFSYLKRNN